MPVVNFTPKVSGKYTVQIRLYESKGDFDSVCISAMMGGEVSRTVRSRLVDPALGCDPPRGSFCNCSQHTIPIV